MAPPFINLPIYFQLSFMGGCRPSLFWGFTDGNLTGTTHTGVQTQLTYVKLAREKFRLGSLRRGLCWQDFLLVSGIHQALTFLSFLNGCPCLLSPFGLSLRKSSWSEGKFNQQRIYRASLLLALKEDLEAMIWDLFKWSQEESNLWLFSIQFSPLLLLRKGISKEGHDGFMHLGWTL